MDMLAYESVMSSRAAAVLAEGTETDRINNVFKDLLTPVANLLARMNLDGKWGFLLLAGVATFCLVQNRGFDLSEAVLTYQNTVALISGLVTTTGLYVAHGASKASGMATQAIAKKSGPLAVSLFTNLHRSAVQEAEALRTLRAETAVVPLSSLDALKSSPSKRM